MLRLEGGCPGVELGTSAEAPPERDDLLGRRLPAPRGEQKLLGQRPQVHRVGLAPRQGVARQGQRSAHRQQGVGSHRGHTGAGCVERPELLPARRCLQELRRDAPQRVFGPGEVVGPHGNDHWRLVRGRGAGVPGRPGIADDLGVGHHGRGRRIRRPHPVRFAGLSGGCGLLPERVLRLLVGSHLIGRDHDPRVLVAERLVEYGRALAVPGLVGIAVGLRARDVCGGRDVQLLVGAPISPTHDHHQEPEAGDPGEQQEPRDDVHDVAGRIRPVVDAGAGVGPVRRQGQLGRAEQQHDRCQPADSHQNGERIPEGRRGQAPQWRPPSGGLADGRASDAASPGGRFDTSGDSTGLAGSSTLRMDTSLQLREWIFLRQRRARS